MLKNKDIEILIMNKVKLRLINYFRSSLCICDIEDAISNAYIKAMNSKYKFENEKALEKWLYKTSKNDVFEWIRKKKKIDEIEFGDCNENEYCYKEWNLNVDEIDADTKLICVEIIKDLRNSLIGCDQMIFYWHINMKLPFIKVAKKLRMKEDAVKKRYQRALIKIRIEFLEFEKIMKELELLPEDFTFIKIKL